MKERLAKLKALKLSYNKNNSDDDFEPAASPTKKKRVRVTSAVKKSAAKTTIAKTTRKKAVEKSYTIEKILQTWNEASEYGISFRGMTPEEQQVEVIRMNKGAEKGLKSVIKLKMLDVNFKVLIANKMKEYLSESRTPLEKIFHASPKTFNAVLYDPNFISVGEWVEVDADRTPGFNSEGGIAVIIQVHDALVDVKYVLTRWVEKMIPLRRLTTIVMPHRGPRASLRTAKTATVEVADKQSKGTVNNQFRTMSAIQILKYGLNENLWKKKGWLFDLLHREGIVDGSRQSRKETCWAYYKSQMLYIEAMQEARDDAKYDPRRKDHKTGKDGKFIKVKKGTVKPKNALTVTFLCFAFEVPYATFKRWKNDAFVTQTHLPEHKGKSVITDKVWASKIFNARRMYMDHSMALWTAKHPAKKYDSKAKKV